MTERLGERYAEVIRKFPKTQAETDALALQKGRSPAQRPLPPQPVAPVKPVAPSKPTPPSPLPSPEQFLAEARKDYESAAVLYKSYLVDKDAAQRKYKGKAVELSGTLYTAKWSPDRKEGLYIILETGIKSFVVSAWFDGRHEKEVLGLKQGQAIRVRGNVGNVGVTKNQGEVFFSLDDCVIASSVP